MRVKKIVFILLSVFVFGSCSKNGGSDPPPPVILESVAQTWSGSEYTIKTPVEKGNIHLTVSGNISGAAKLLIPSTLTSADNPIITIDLSAGASFTNSLSISSGDYQGTVVLKHSANNKVAVGTDVLSANQILLVNLPKGSFTVASGKINGKASIITRPGTFTLGGVIAGDLIVEKGSVKIIVGGEAITITIKDNEPLVIEGNVSGTITIASGYTSPVTIGAGVTVGAVVAPASSVVIESSATKTTTVGTIAGKDVVVGNGATTKDIVISDGGTIKVNQGGQVDGNLDASNASSADIPDGSVSGEFTRPSLGTNGSIDDWNDITEK